MKVQTVYFTGIIFLFLLIFSVSRSCLAGSFEVQLENFEYQKETIDLEPPPESTFNVYDYSSSRNDWDIQGTFIEEATSTM